MSFWENFWDIFWWFFIVYAIFAFLYALFIVIADLFRDHELSGWWKAVWFIFLAFVPFLTLLVYMIARGKGMTERSMERARRNQEEADAYIRQVATASPTEEISKAKALLDSGTISPDEFQRLKTRVMS
ncbi:type VI protein secretion system component VasK [Pseudarthrobacter oxydans]|uniref:SHOCT domain-containing protein n=1 Tax=Pseudarthrobacter oxydans TaxID=1671 RepID=UPI00278B7F1D|nr:SHOCT domain-containing protein [Pseudarthrobacter oxydans]MDP9983745.1 type VI protein secretion system component VasK [Pseudarthrobacter oxydans]